ARFIDNDDIEPCGAGIEVLDNTGEWHDPDEDGSAAFAHFSRRFGAQERDPDAMALADPADRIKPADQRLALPRRSAASLRGPGPLVDQLDCRAAKLLAQFFTLRLQSLE